MSIGGLDVGSGGCKCTIFNEDGSVSTYAYREYYPQRMESGYMELNPYLVWDCVKQVIKQAADAHSGSPLDSLCLTSFGEVGVCIDADGNILRNSLLYTDFRGGDQAKAFENKLGRDEIVKRSGHIPHPMYSFSKILWLRDNEPDIYKKTDTFLQYSEFILFMLSGERRVDWSLASRTCMFNVIEKKFDEVLLEAADIDKDIFPEPIQPGLVSGHIKRELASELGLSRNMLVILGGQDQICAALGAGVLTKGQAINGIGSVDCITPLFDKPNINKSMADAGFSCVPYLIPDHYVTFAFNYSGGALLKWYKDKFGDAVVLNSHDAGKNPYSAMECGAPKMPTDLLILPHFQGAATPYMDTAATGAIIGLTIDDDAYSIYRGVLEGVAYEMRVIYDALKHAGVNIDRLSITGGGSRSDMWNQIRADLFGVPMDVLEFEEAGTLGAAILAGRANGLFKNLQHGVDSMVKVKSTFYPNEKTSEIYEANYEKYRKVYNAVKDIQGR